MKKITNPSSLNSKPKRTTPYAQLTKLLQTREQVTILYETLEPLTEVYKEDFCIACIAYIKFGIKRPFENRVMQVLFASYCDLLDN